MVRLKVSEADIQKSATLVEQEAFDLELVCPVALALNRQLGGKWSVKRLQTHDTLSNRELIVTNTLAIYIGRHDAGKEIKPHTFVLEFESQAESELPVQSKG